MVGHTGDEVIKAGKQKRAEGMLGGILFFFISGIKVPERRKR